MGRSVGGWVEPARGAAATLPPALPSPRTALKPAVMIFGSADATPNSAHVAAFSSSGMSKRRDSSAPEKGMIGSPPCSATHACT